MRCQVMMPFAHWLKRCATTLAKRILSMSARKVTALNKLERRAFYSFLSLYLISSTLFLLLLGFWYYLAQKNAIESESYYTMTHLADTLGAQIISAQMKGTTLELKERKGLNVYFVSTSEPTSLTPGFFQTATLHKLVSESPQEHLHIRYVVITSSLFVKKITQLKVQVISIMAVSFIVILLISYLLSRLFMRPLHQRMHQIEQFIMDISHELNTPISALKMSVSRAKSNENLHEQMLQNISISTKQLERLYQSLSYLNFEQQPHPKEQLELNVHLHNILAYYTELLSTKNLTLQTDIESCTLNMAPMQLELLLSNLLSNAIKYSLQGGTITITLKSCTLQICDEGVGIAPEKLQSIFEPYVRASHVAGGFGVGLHVVKSICDSNQITIDVKSQPQKGTCFTLQFTSPTA